MYGWHAEVLQCNATIRALYSTWTMLTEFYLHFRNNLRLFLGGVLKNMKFNFTRALSVHHILDDHVLKFFRQRGIHGGLDCAAFPLDFLNGRVIFR